MLRAVLAARVEEGRLGLAEACLSTRLSLGSDGLGHEAAYSIYGPGAFLERHLDEVSLDKVVREGSERGNKGKTMRVFARPDSLCFLLRADDRSCLFSVVAKPEHEELKGPKAAWATTSRAVFLGSST